MSPAKSRTTRLLCASAFLAGPPFREKILRHFEHESRGATPELGVDMGLVVMVCAYARNLARRFDLYFFLALLASVLAWGRAPAVGIAVLVMVSAAIYFEKTHRERFHLAAKFREETFNETTLQEWLQVRIEKKVLDALPREDQNLVVYSGFTPFVGAGTHLGGWSFVVDILKCDSTMNGHGTVTPFTVEELYADVASGISSSHLEGLVIKDFYFINGREIRGNRELLPDIYGRPVQFLNRESASRYVSSSDERLRHYMWIRLHDWAHELVTSYFLRFSIRGRCLFVEINRFQLSPLKAEYRKIDALADVGDLELFGMLTASLVLGPVHALFSPFQLFGRLVESGEDLFGGKERARRERIDKDLLFDYGAGKGNRHELSGNRFEHYFQKADGDFCAKALESIILDRTIAFLDEHHVDTSSLRERQNTILNSGIIVHGGDVRAESLAVGHGAKAVKAFKSRVAEGVGP